LLSVGWVDSGRKYVACLTGRPFFCSVEPRRYDLLAFSEWFCCMSLLGACSPDADAIVFVLWHAALPRSFAVCCRHQCCEDCH
jgi:hypothetical protein